MREQCQPAVELVQSCDQRKVAQGLAAAQDGAGEESDAVQQAEAASLGAAQSGFPSREAAAQAGAELAQRLGLAPDQALDKIVSTVLQQGWGGERGLSVTLITKYA
jgi:hypothetical protein